MVVLKWEDGAKGNSGRYEKDKGGLRGYPLYLVRVDFKTLINVRHNFGKK